MLLHLSLNIRQVERLIQPRRIRWTQRQLQEVIVPLLLIHDKFLHVVKGRNHLAQQTASCAIRFIAANFPCSDHLSACKSGPSVAGEV